MADEKTASGAWDMLITNTDTTNESNDKMKFLDPWKVSPVEMAAASPGAPEGWPQAVSWPRDKWYYWNGGWLDRDEIDAAFAGWKKGDPIGYIRDKVPEFSIPNYASGRYEALAPDTLDIQAVQCTD